MTCWELLCPISKADYTMTFLFPSTAINQYGGKVLFYSDLASTDGKTKRKTSRCGPFSSCQPPHMPIDSNFIFRVSSKHKLFARRSVSQWNHQPFCCAEGKAPYEPSSRVPCSPFSLLRSHSRSCFKTFFPMAWKINENFYFPPPPLLVCWEKGLRGNFPMKRSNITKSLAARGSTAKATINSVQYVNTMSLTHEREALLNLWSLNPTKSAADTPSCCW